MKILVLSTSPGNVATKSIVRAGEAKGHEMIVKSPKWLYLLISDSVNGYDRVYDGYGQSDKPVKLALSSYDAIIPRLGNNLNYSLAVLEHLNHNLRIFSTQSASGIRTASDKLISQQKFSQWKLKTPKTILGDQALHPEWMIKQIGNLPGIAKTIRGSLGNGVYLLQSPLQTNIFLQNFSKAKNKLLLQSYINTGDQSRDIRSICIDGKVVVAMERLAKKGEIRANIDKGGSGRRIELSEADQEICIRACNSVGLKCAGVDLIKDQDGQTFVIEINGNYGYKIESITQTDISTPLIEYCEREHKNKPNPMVTQQAKENDPAMDYFNELRSRMPATFGSMTFEQFRENMQNGL